jgi:phage repressor protein C with HTH and peptisase S24 domain
MAMKKVVGNIPEWARRIVQLREQLKLDRTQLARELQYSPMTISRWERGLQEPPTDSYIKLGKLADGSDPWFFWERAGLKKEDFSASPAAKSKFEKIEVVTAGTGAKKYPLNKTKLAAIPLLKVHAGTHGERGDNLRDLNQAPQEDMFAVPLSWCPHPESTRCLRVKGKSMAPFLNDNDIVVVDSSQTKHTDLSGKIVVSWHKEKGLSVSRFRKIDHVELLESDNREYQSITLSNREWRIVGKVLWVIRQTN